jgi:hypothetical protein
MKSLFIIPAVLAGFIPTSVEAKLLPHLYAQSYCELRSMGATHDSAQRAAIEQATITGDDVKVEIGGRTYDYGVVKAIDLVNDQCPQYD